jgi:hypothetical protein
LLDRAAKVIFEHFLGSVQFIEPANRQIFNPPRPVDTAEDLVAFCIGRGRRAASGIMSCRGNTGTDIGGSIEMSELVGFREQWKTAPADPAD